MTTASLRGSATLATTAQWDKAAAGWNASAAIIRPWLKTATAAMIRMAGVEPGMRVLDLAAGAGDQTLDLAASVGLQGSVLATDLSPQILALAASNARDAGFANVETLVADGEDLPLAGASFDAAICRLGLMLFPQPLQGLRHVHRLLRPGARACTMVFAAPDRNPCLTILMSTALKHAGLPPADPYRPGSLLSLGKPGLLEELFAEAGFRDIVTTSVSAPFELPSVDAYLDFIRSSAAPVLAMLARLDDQGRQAAWSDMKERLAEFDTADGWSGPNELLLTSAVR